MFKAAIFDVDGVVVNTVPLHFGAWKKMFSEYGKNFTFNDYKDKVDGIPRFDGAKAILTGLTDDEIREAATKKQSYFLDLVEKKSVSTYDSTIKFVKELKGLHKKIAFASSSKNCKTILKKTGITFFADAIVDGNEITKGKPDPQIFQLAYDKLKCVPEESIVFEDAVLGVEAAINGGMFCVGIDRHNDPGRLSRANIVITDLSELDYKELERLFNSQ